MAAAEREAVRRLIRQLPRPTMAARTDTSVTLAMRRLAYGEVRAYVGTPQTGPLHNLLVAPGNDVRADRVFLLSCHQCTKQLVVTYNDTGFHRHAHPVNIYVQVALYMHTLSKVSSAPCMASCQPASQALVAQCSCRAGACGSWRFAPRRPRPGGPWAPSRS